MKIKISLMYLAPGNDLIHQKIMLGDAPQKCNLQQ